MARRQTPDALSRGQQERRRALIDEISESSDSDSELPLKRFKVSHDIFKSVALNTTAPVENVSDVPDETPWTLKHRPQSLNDVSMNSRKIDELRTALTRLLARDQNSPRILIVSGPTGSSKTSAVYCILKTMGYDSQSLVEWSNHDPLGYGLSLSSAFVDFMNAAVYQRDKVIVIEDLPNLFHLETRDKFCEALTVWLYSKVDYSKPLPPVVLIVSEFYFDSMDPRDSLLVEQKLTRTLLYHPLTIHVKASSINKQLLTKSLKRIVSLERSVFGKFASKDIDRVIKFIVTAGNSAEADGCGNIRVAVGLLEVWVKSLPPSTAQKIDIGASLSPIAPQLDFFHAIGRIIYGRRKDKSGNPISHDQSAVDSVLQTWEDLNIDGTMTHTVFENYTSAHKSLLSVASAHKCADIISQADVLQGSFKHITSLDRHSYAPLEVSMVSDLCFRGVRYNLRNATLVDGGRPVFKQLAFHNQRKVDLEQRKISAELGAYIQSQRARGFWLGSEGVTLWDGYYTVPISRNMQRRAGGPLASQFTVGGDTGPNQFSEDTTEAQHIPFVPTISAVRPGSMLSDDEIESDSSEN